MKHLTLAPSPLAARHGVEHAIVPDDRTKPPRAVCVHFRHAAGSLGCCDSVRVVNCHCVASCCSVCHFDPDSLCVLSGWSDRQNRPVGQVLTYSTCPVRLNRPGLSGLLSGLSGLSGCLFSSWFEGVILLSVFLDLTCFRASFADQRTNPNTEIGTVQSGDSLEHSSRFPLRKLTQ